MKNNFLEKSYKFIIGAMLLFVAIVSVLNARNDSLIYDEDAHIPAGYSYLKEHDMRLNPEHPPLIKDFSAAPLLAMNLNFDISQDFWTKDNADDSQWNAGKSFLFNSGNNPDKIIFWSRLPIILLSLILGLFIFKWTRELAGISAGLFALALYAFDPNILGHNHFVTTDIGIAAFIAFAFYYFLKFIKEPNGKNILTAGLFLGLMQLVKFSSVLTFPVFGILIIFYPLVKINEAKGKLKNLGEYFWKGAAVFAISVVIVWIAYYANTYNMPQTKLPEIMDHYFKPYDTRPINVYARAALLTMNRHEFLMPITDYLFGIARVFQRVAGGNITYFMGEISNKGFLSYFPIVFLIKEPLIILLFFLSALIISFLNITKNILNLSGSFIKNLFSKSVCYLRTDTIGFSLLLFIIIYSATSITGGLNIGFRHLFPILPLAYILTARSIFQFIKNRKNYQTKSVLYISVIILTIFLLSETIMAYPFYTSYFNQLVGGPKNGYRYVTDSNADWGQDLKRLSKFLSRHLEINFIRTDYFGMADIKYYLGDKYAPWWKAKRPIESGWYAISALLLQEGIYSKDVPDNRSYRWLQNKKSRYQIGTSIFIYYISKEEAAESN